MMKNGTSQWVCDVLNEVGVNFTVYVLRPSNKPEGERGYLAVALDTNYDDIYDDENRADWLNKHSVLPPQIGDFPEDAIGKLLWYYSKHSLLFLKED